MAPAVAVGVAVGVVFSSKMVSDCALTEGASGTEVLGGALVC